MPIKGITEKRRLPRKGKIRLGIKVDSGKKNKKGDPVMYPKSVDYFVCPDEVQAVYGEQPKELDILFPVEDEEQFFSQFYKMYTASGLKCKGDGEMATVLIEVDSGKKDKNKKPVMVMKMEEGHECPGELCPEYIAKKCKRVAILQVLLPKIKGIGVYQISTSSFHSIININSMVDYVRALCGRVAMIPLRLKVEDQTVQPDGKKKIVHVLTIDANIRLADLQKAGDMDPQRIALPSPDETEEDLLLLQPTDTEPEVIQEEVIEAEPVVEVESAPAEAPAPAEIMADEKTIAEIMDNADVQIDAGRFTKADFNKRLHEAYGVNGVAGLTQAQADEILAKLAPPKEEPKQDKLIS